MKQYTDLSRRTDVNAFLTVPNRQGESTLYSAVNVPDKFELPRQVHTNPANNMSDKALRHMQYANSACPEIPYVLHNIPMNDPLLGRLGPDCGWLYPVSYTNGWGMHDDIRHSWWQLERGLMLISDTLLELDSSNAGKEVYRAEKWPEPSSFRYRDAHGQFHGAATAIRLSWTAMLVLAARCSMAIALWNKNLTSGIPHWVVRLQQSGIPSSWIEALQSSAITDFSLGLRVGVVIQPAHCPWMSHVPFYRLAGCPTFVEWGTKPKMLSEFIKVYPVLGPFVPYKMDVEICANNLPRKGAEHIFYLSCRGRGRWLPVNERIEARLATKPSGPFQRPGESWPEFRDRMARHKLLALQNETPEQAETRRRRETAASKKTLPPKWVRVYVWMKVRDVFPDIKFYDWRDLDYRVELPAAAVAGLWSTYPEDGRHYNSVFNEWDLTMHDVVPNVTEYEQQPMQILPDYDTDVHSLYSVVERDIYPRQDPARLRAAVQFNSEEYIYQHYGLLASTAMYPEDPDIDYDEYNTPDLYKYFAFSASTAENFTNDNTVRRVWAAWVKNMLNNNGETGTATQDCWDMHFPSPQFLITPAVTSKVRVQSRTNVLNQQVYEVRYLRDPDPADWVLVVTPRVLLFLLRNHALDTSVSAVVCCITNGAPFQTVQAIAASAIPVASEAQERPTVRNPVMYRHGKEAEKLVLKKSDYLAYRVRCLSMLREPQIRGALSYGGVIWRLTLELLLADEGLYHRAVELCVAGPVLDRGKDSLVLVFPSGADGTLYVDNRINDQQADILCGMYWRYCGKFDVV